MRPLVFNDDDATWLAGLPLGELIDGDDMAILWHNYKLTPTERFNQHFKILECLERAHYQPSKEDDQLSMHDLVLDARLQKAVNN